MNNMIAMIRFYGAFSVHLPPTAPNKVDTKDARHRRMVLNRATQKEKIRLALLQLQG
jgi:hypothetical protein